MFLAPATHSVGHTVLSRWLRRGVLLHVSLLTPAPSWGQGRPPDQRAAGSAMHTRSLPSATALAASPVCASARRIEQVGSSHASETQNLRKEGNCWDGIRVPAEGHIPGPVLEARAAAQRGLWAEQVRCASACDDLRLRTVSPAAGWVLNTPPPRQQLRNTETLAAQSGLEFFREPTAGFTFLLSFL